MAKAKKKISKTSKPSKAKVQTKAKTKAAPKMKTAPKVKTVVKKTTSAKSPAPKLKAAPAVAPKKTPKDVSKAFTPLDDRVLVSRQEVELRTPGGLYIPDSVASSERPTQGKVVAVGRGRQDKKGKIRPLDVQNGDTVMFAAFAGSEITIDDQQLLILREQDILAVVKP